MPKLWLSTMLPVMRGIQLSVPNSTKPTSVKNIEVMSFSGRIEGRHHWVDHGLTDSVGDRKKKHRDIKAPVNTVSAKSLIDRVRTKLQGGGQNVHEKSKEHESPVTDLI